MNPSRRSLMRSAAWAVPVVSVAAAAPTFAASGAPALAFGDFDVYPVFGTDADGWYYDVSVESLVVTASGDAPPVQVMLTFAFTADGGPGMANENADAIIEWYQPTGWSTVSTAFVPGHHHLLQWSSVASITSGTPLSIADQYVIFGAASYRVVGQFTVTASASGYAPVTRTFRTGAVPDAKVVPGPLPTEGADVQGRARRLR